MKNTILKIIKRFVVSVLILFFILAISIGIALNFIFTPDKITPTVVEVLNRNLKADLQVESIELTFFSSFPNFSLELKNGLICNTIIVDSVPNSQSFKKDSLISFEYALVSLNPVAFLKKNEIKINKVLFEKPTIYAFVSKDGFSNWDILKTEKVLDTTQNDTEKFKADLDIEDITLKNASLVYDNRSTRIYASLDSLDLKLNAAYNNKAVLLGLKMDTRKAIFWQKGKTLVKDLSVALATHLVVDRETKVMNISETKVRLNNIEFLTNGKLVPDKEKKELGINLDVNLEIPKLETLMRLIPENVLEQGKDLSTKGSISFYAKVEGVYGNGNMPTIDAQLRISDGEIQYKEMPNKIDLIAADITAFIDISKKTPSSIIVNSFKLKSTGTDISLSGKGNNIFKNPQLLLNANGKLNFNVLNKSLPLKKGVAIAGLADMDLEGTLFLNDVLRNDYGKISANGKIKLDNIKLNYKTDSLVFETKKAMAIFGQTQNSKALTEENSKVLGGKVDISGLKFSIAKNIKGSAEHIAIGFGTTPWIDSTKVANLKSKMRLKNVHFNMADTLKGMLGEASAIINISPSFKDKGKPSIHTEFTIDSTGVTSQGKFIGITQGEYKLDLVKNSADHWPATGYISFKQLYAYTPLFPLLIKMPKTKATILPDAIELNGAQLEIGNSDIKITGKVYELNKTLLEKKTLKAELAVTSSNIDINELIKTLNDGVTLDEAAMSELMASDTVPNQTDSTVMKTFIVPKGIDFKFESSFDKVVFGDLVIKDLHGLITVKDQEIHLADLRMNTLAANMATSMRYAAKEKTKASIDFDFGLTDIDIKNLVQLMPALDTLFPMARSFEGNVNFKMKGKSKLNDTMGVDIPTLEAIASIEGQNLVVLDGETFSELSKTLMFKNKKRNVIDSLSFEMMVEGNIMEVFPSLITLDRYKVAVGGQHKLDMTYKYHVSVLKSPMPFKAGIDFTGDLEDFDFKITKAKYKYLFSDKRRQQVKADSSLLKKKEAILRRLKF